MWGIIDIIRNITIFDIIDISIVAYLFYNAYLLIKETRAEQLIKGIVILLISSEIFDLMQFQVMGWLLDKTMTVGIIALLIVFQPELRRALEQLGRTEFLIRGPQETSKDKIEGIVTKTVNATRVMSKSKIGALIVFERETGLSEIINTGTLLDAVLSPQLFLNIFEPNTPLHDGAVIVRGNKIMAAGCFLPLTDNNELNQEVGTRHRAALGMSEKSDSIILIVSEETGYVSIADNGKLYRDLTEEDLSIYLKRSLKATEKKGFSENGAKDE